MTKSNMIRLIKNLLKLMRFKTGSRPYFYLAFLWYKNIRIITKIRIKYSTRFRQ